VSLATYIDLLLPTSKNFTDCSEGEWTHDDATGQDYRMKIVDNDVLLIEFEYTTPDKKRKTKLLSVDWMQNFDFLPKKMYMYDTPIRVHRGFF